MKFLLALIASTAAVKIPIRQLAQAAIDNFDLSGDGTLNATEAENAIDSIPGVNATMKADAAEAFLENGKIPTTTFMAIARQHMSKKQAAQLWALANTDNSPTAITTKELAAAQPLSGYTEEQLKSWFEDDVVIGKRGLKRALHQLFD